LRALTLVVALAAAGCVSFESPETAPPPGGGGAAGHGGAGASGGGGEGAGAAGGAGAGAGGACAAVLEADFTGGSTVPTSDSFEDVTATRATWRARFFEETLKGLRGSTDATVCDGRLTIVPPEPEELNGGTNGFFFYAGQGGPWVHQRISGDFAFEVDMESIYGAVDGQIDGYSGASIVIGHPSVDGYWQVFSLGSTADGIEGTYTTRLTTVREPAGSFHHELRAASEAKGRLLACRIGGTFSFHRRLAEDEGPVTLAHHGDPELSHVDPLDVGLTSTWWAGTRMASLEGRFTEARFHSPPATHQACAALLGD
jgi:hypothetical protein